MADVDRMIEEKVAFNSAVLLSDVEYNSAVLFSDVEYNSSAALIEQITNVVGMGDSFQGQRALSLPHPNSHFSVNL